MLTAEHMLRTGTVYEDLTERYFDTRDRLKLVHRLVRRLGDLGVQVELKPDGFLSRRCGPQGRGRGRCPGHRQWLGR